MRYFLACLLASISLCVFAAPLAVAPNSNGGVIVLTNDACEGAESAMMAYTTDPNDGSVEYGCWLHLRGAIQIYWKSLGQIMAYDPSAFRPPSPSDAM